MLFDSKNKLGVWKLFLALAWAAVLLGHTQLPADEPIAPKLAVSEAAKSGTESATGENQASETKVRFVRLVSANDKPVSLDTAIVTYVPSDPAQADVTVELVGAVHVGDKSYYEALNKEFEKYDVLLYELVAPENTRVPRERKGGPTSAVGGLQLGMKELLGLEFQLDEVDYTKANFVHADMSPEEFAKSMTQRGESFSQIFFKMMGYGFAQQGKTSAKSPEMEMLMAMFAKNRALKMKIAMAEQFDALEGQMDILDGPEGSTILTERNRKAFEVLKRELAAGKKKVGVFYGAAHLPDMEKRLINDFGMKRNSERWLPAWSLEENRTESK